MISAAATTATTGSTPRGCCITGIDGIFTIVVTEMNGWNDVSDHILRISIVMSRWGTMTIQSMRWFGYHQTKFDTFIIFVVVAIAVFATITISTLMMMMMMMLGVDIVTGVVTMIILQIITVE
jgi:hypothetical protein